MTNNPDDSPLPGNPDPKADHNPDPKAELGFPAEVVNTPHAPSADNGAFYGFYDPQVGYGVYQGWSPYHGNPAQYGIPAPYANPAPYNVYVTGRRTNSKAILSLILAILAFACCTIFTAIPAVIVGVAARQEIRRSNEEGGTLALAGIILGTVNIVLSVLYILFLFVVIDLGASSP